MRQQAAPIFFVERCAVQDPIDFLKIKFLGIEACAGGRFAIVALVVIFFASGCSLARMIRNAIKYGHYL